MIRISEEKWARLPRASNFASPSVMLLLLFSTCTLFHRYMCAICPVLNRTYTEHIPNIYRRYTEQMARVIACCSEA